jgi:hypothetical protein
VDVKALKEGRAESITESARNYLKIVKKFQARQSVV